VSYLSWKYGIKNYQASSTNGMFFGMLKTAIVRRKRTIVMETYLHTNSTGAFQGAATVFVARKNGLKIRLLSGQNKISEQVARGCFSIVNDVTVR